MGFSEYLYDLAHRIFKRSEPKTDSDIFKYTSSIGPDYDAAMESIVKLREQSQVVTATGKALDYHGQDRNMPRYPGEDDEAYRLRLLNAFSYYQALGTKGAIIKALTRLGYTEADIKELYLTDAERWAEFIVRLEIDDYTPFGITDSQRIYTLIRTMKPAHTKMANLNLRMLSSTLFNLNHAFGVKLKLNPRSNVWAGSPGQPEVYFDGTTSFDGEYFFSGRRTEASASKGPGHVFKIRLKNAMRHHFGTFPELLHPQFDGQYLFDGTLNFDSVPKYMPVPMKHSILLQVTEKAQTAIQAHNTFFTEVNGRAVSNRVANFNGRYNFDGTIHFDHVLYEQPAVMRIYRNGQQQEEVNL